MNLVVPAIVDPEDTDVKLDCESFCQKGDDSGIDSQFKSIGLSKCSVCISTACIESLALFERASETYIGKHCDTLRSSKRNICSIYSMNTVLVLYLITILCIH